MELMPRADKHGGPLGVCRTTADYILPMTSLPPPTVFKTDRPVSKVSVSVKSSIYDLRVSV